MTLRAHGRVVFLLSGALILLTTSCKTESTDTAGVAYVAPANINLHPSLADRNGSVAVLNHGERVRIVDVRRRFVKIRTTKGVEGWVDATQLLTPEQMDEFNKEAAHALTLPAQGRATVYEALNIHLEPSRQSPAFAKIPDGGSVEVLGHRIAERATGLPNIPVFTLPQSPEEAARRQRKERKGKNSPGLRPPPRPPAPKPPDNWQAILNDEHAGAPEAAVPAQAAPAQKQASKQPVVIEDWTLVRTKDKQCGWVLSRNLILSIPDEVAQYAEGKRITSYFDLGAVQDEAKGPHHNWLWTTASEVEEPDFDAWRVFLWNRRRHRYETSYRQRDVEGYFPVRVDPPEGSSPERRFALILKQDDGKLVRRQYLFDGTRVHLTAQDPYQPSIETSSASALEKKPTQGRSGWIQKTWTAVRKRISGSSQRPAQK